MCKNHYKEIFLKLITPLNVDTFLFLLQSMTYLYLGEVAGAAFTF